jgi:O-antigen ligase
MRSPQFIPFFMLLAILPFPGTVALRLSCLAVAFAYVIYAWKRLAVPTLPCKYILAAWALLAFASLFYAVDPAYSLGEIKNELGYTILAFVAFFAISGDERRMQGMLLALAAGAFVLCTAALAARFSLDRWDEAGWYGGSASFASYLAAAVPAIALLGCYFKGVRWRYMSISLLGLLLVAGFYCLQRIVWPVLFLQASVVLLLYRKKLGFNVIRIAGALIVLALIASALFSVTQVIRSQNLEGSTPGTEMRSDDRPVFWPGVVERIMEHPQTGAGFGRGVMSKAYPDLIPRENQQLWHAHNVVLNYGLAMGIPGMVVLLMLFGALLREYARFWQSDDQDLRMIAACGIVLVLGVFSRNMVNDMFVRDAALLFWALNGMLLGLGRRQLAAAQRGAA